MTFLRSRRIRPGNALAILLALAPAASSGAITAKLTVDGSEASRVEARKASEWTLRVFDAKTGAQLTRFKALHGRKMHLIVVKDDLSSFAHVHPEPAGDSGVFRIAVNQLSFDPDNQQASSVVPTAGRYFVFAEVFPNRGSLMPVPEVAKLEIEASSPRPPGPPTSLDEVFSAAPATSVSATSEEPALQAHEHPDMQVRYFKLLRSTDRLGRVGPPVGLEPGAYGDTYKVSLHIETVPGCGGNLVRFHFMIQEWDSAQEGYLHVQKLDDWLRMAGHAVLMNADAAALDEQEFFHLHAMHDHSAHHLTFPHFDRGKMRHRNFKLWGQFKHNGYILTFPFAFHYSAEARSDCR
jgi:hypothetical protein